MTATEIQSYWNLVVSLSKNYKMMWLCIMGEYVERLLPKIMKKGKKKHRRREW